MAHNYLFNEGGREGHYTADAFIVRCFDNRFWKPFKHFVKKLALTDIDTESIAGGAKVFASPEKEGDRDFILRELEKSIKLHLTKKVMLFSHSDCGAYGGLSRFGNNMDDELKFHAEEHKKAIKIIHTRFPDIPVETYFIDQNGIIKTY